MQRPIGLRAGLSAVAGAAFLALAAGVSAQGFMPWTEILEMADKNRDGMVTMEEVNDAGMKRDPVPAGFQPWMGMNFNAIDLNQDGMVTMEEVDEYLSMHDMTSDDLTEAWYQTSR
jgi:hypothetical protein